MKCLLILPDWFFPAWDLELHIYLEVNSLAIATWGSWLAPCSWDHTIFWLLLSMQERGKCCACVGSVPINKTISHIPTLIKIIAYRSFFFFFKPSMCFFRWLQLQKYLEGIFSCCFLSIPDSPFFWRVDWGGHSKWITLSLSSPPSCASRITN